MSTDPEKVPESPVYTITLTNYGTATIDGEDLPINSGSADEARVAALYEIRIKAALHGRPVRVTAKEADGSVWPLIVDVDGSVTTCDHPHPTPAPSPAPPAAPARTQAPPSPHSAPPPPAPAAPSEAPPVMEVQTGDWSAPLPAEYRALWDQLRKHEAAGALVEAIIVADQIERGLAELYGRSHPHTVNMLTVRAWLTLCRRTEWAETLELLIEAAQRRQEANAPQEDTARLVRNAHGAWRKLAREDPEGALEMADQVMTLLDGDEKRAGDVIRWIESGAARHSTT